MGAPIKKISPIRSSNPVNGNGPVIPQMSPIRRNYDKSKIGGRFNVGITGIGDSQFDVGVPLALVDNLAKIRSERQPWLHQASNAILGGLASGLLTAGETISNILDIPENIKTASTYFSKDDNLNVMESSAAATFFKESKEKLLNEYLPIYRKDPSKIIDFNDSAFYWESFRGVVDSATGFGLTGMGAGAAVKAVGSALRLSRLGAYTNMIGRAVNATAKGLESGVAGRLTTAYITNFGEGKMMGLELYEKATKENYQLYLDKYKADFELGLNETDTPSAEELKEFEFQAKVNAGKQANAFMLRNKLFIGTDYMQLNSMFKATGLGITNKLVKKPSFGAFAKSQALNAPKEAFEEIGQNVIQMEGIFQTRKSLASKGYVTSDKRLEDMTLSERFTEFAMSEQALLEGAMGMFGGPVQYAITQAPFQKKINKSRMEHFTSQQQEFVKNKDYIDQTLYKSIFKKLTEESLEDVNEITANEANEITNDYSFAMIAVRNFSMGTTQNLREQINELKEAERVTPEVIKNIDKQISKLDALEKEYLNLRKYSTSDELMALSIERKLNDSGKNILEKGQSKLLSEISKRITSYNNIFETQFTFDEYLNNKDKELSDHFVEFMYESEIVQEYKNINFDIKDFDKTLMEIDRATDQFKNKNNQSVMEYIKENVMSPSILTEDKIKLLRLARTKLKGDHIKDNLNIKIKTLESELNNVVDNEGIEEKGGVDKIIKKVKEDNIKSKKPGAPSNVTPTPTIQDENPLAQFEQAKDEGVNPQPPIEAQIPDTGPKIGNPSDIQNIPKEVDMTNQQIEDFVNKSMMGVLPEDQINGIFDNKVRDGLLSQNEAEQFKRDITDKDQEDAIEQGVKPVFSNKKVEVNEAASTNEDITNLQNWNDDSLDTMAKTIIKNSQSSNSKTNTETDVKISFNNPKSPKFMEFLASNNDKTNIPIEFVVDEDITNFDVLRAYKEGKKTEEVLNELAIKVVINGDSEMYTYLFKPRKQSNGQWGTGGKAERQLRGQIIDALRDGKKPKGKIKYQYSGIFKSDGISKNVLEISGFESASDVKLMYVNKEGHLYDADTKDINTDYNSVINVKKANIPWAGALFTEVKSPNGSKIPIKLNLRKLSKNETALIIGIYTNIISPATPGKVNYKDSLMSESSELYDLLPQIDKAFLGENVKVSEVLDHLIFNGTNTLNNPATQLYYNKGVLNFGEDSLTLAELGNPIKMINFQKFLEQFKSRTVNVNKLSDPKYKNLMIDNQVINTDVTIDQTGNIFQSDATDSTNPINRYKTKAIYIANHITNNLEKSIKKTTVAEKKEDMKDRIKNVVVGDKKVISKEMDRLRKNMQSKVDKIKRRKC